MKIEQTECSETSAHKIQTTEIHPKELTHQVLIYYKTAVGYFSSTHRTTILTVNSPTCKKTSISNRTGVGVFLHQDTARTRMQPATYFIVKIICIYLTNYLHFYFLCCLQVDSSVARDFIFSTPVQTDPGAHLTSCTMGTEVLSWG
jgi:hypothetical protein